ncbi:MAG: flagellar hook-basal body protein [Nitrospinota bacterium]
MYKGMFIAVAGAKNAQLRLDTSANNLANVETVGFKRDRVLFESYLAEEGEKLSFDSTFPVAAKTISDYSEGPFKSRSDNLSVAIKGSGFFELQASDQRKYTKDGAFKVSSDGYLVSSDDMPLLSKHDSPIFIGNLNAKINNKGEVWLTERDHDSDKEILAGTIKIVDFPKPYTLSKAGNNLYSSDVEGSILPTANLESSHVEMSNVNAVQEMVDLIENSRSFESIMKLITEHDSMTGKVAEQVIG